MCKEEIIKQKRCGKYSFRLIGKPKTYFKGITVIDFAPPSKTKKIQKIAILPTYNKDRKYFTPAFLIPSLPLQQDSILIQEHSKRVKENITEISQIMVPKPRSRQKYCGVCRDYYDEYLTHVDTQKHIEKLRNNKFQQFIMQMSQLFQEQNLQKQIQLKKIHSSQFSCETVWSSIQEDLVDACLNLQ